LKEMGNGVLKVLTNSALQSGEIRIYGISGFSHKNIPTLSGSAGLEGVDLPKKVWERWGR